MPSIPDQQKLFMKASARDATFAERNMIPQPPAEPEKVEPKVKRYGKKVK